VFVQREALAVHGFLQRGALAANALLGAAALQMAPQNRVGSFHQRPVDPGVFPVFDNCGDPNDHSPNFESPWNDRPENASHSRVTRNASRTPVASPIATPASPAHRLGSRLYRCRGTQTSRSKLNAAGLVVARPATATEGLGPVHGVGPFFLGSAKRSLPTAIAMHGEAFRVSISVDLSAS
jgi:hypothetical protein